MKLKRKDMPPGTIFGAHITRFPAVLSWDVTAFVVVDDEEEVDFWTGARACFGFNCPSQEFEVL